MSIVTVTFSPAIDKSSSVARLEPDKKLKCAVPHLEPGGGGINVARAVVHLGGKATAVFPSGGFTGKYFNRLMEQEKVPSIIIETQQETRENFVILDESTRMQYRFGMPGTALNSSEWKQILHVIEDITHIDFLVASGSLPPGVPDEVFAQMARIAEKKKAKYIVDVPGEPLRLALNAGVYLIKPNLGELSGLSHQQRLTEKEAGEMAKQFILEGKCEVMVVSMGEQGALLVTKEFTSLFRAPKVERKSTVGAGDSMVAGIVYSLANGRSLTDSVRYGVACGTAATLNPGTALCRKEDADQIYQLIKPE